MKAKTQALVLGVLVMASAAFAADVAPPALPTLPPPPAATPLPVGVPPSVTNPIEAAKGAMATANAPIENPAAPITAVNPAPSSEPATAPAPEVTATGKPTESDSKGSAEVVDASSTNPSGAANGTWVREMAINDLLQVLARRLGLQYFYNPHLSDVMVSGNLEEKVPSVEDIKAMAYQYDVLVDANGRTLVAYSRDQLATLPKKDFIYTLKYLRPNSSFNSLAAATQDNGESKDAGASSSDSIGVDFQRLLKPALSGSGVVTYEPKTNQLVISDNQYSLARAVEMLDRLDVPKKQIIVDVRILRLNSDANKFTGVDWSQTLGAQGLNVGVQLSGTLSQIFNSTPIIASEGTLATAAISRLLGGNTNAAGTNGTGTSGTGTTGTGTTGATPTTTGTVPQTTPGIVLSPGQISFVLRALIENNIAKQESGPAVITEDNEPALFSVVERIPIVEQTVTQGTTSSSPTISTDVRYKIGKDDPSEPPAARREVGVKVAVTPSLLPDGTIRMRLLPTVATVTKYTRVYTGYQNYYNEYPNVNETSVEARARIPDGYTLVLGGYYQDVSTDGKNKVPLLGDIPGLGFAFSSNSRTKTRSNIVFLITPTSYDPSNVTRAVEQSTALQQRFVDKPDSKYPDPNWPKESASPNLAQRLRNLWPWGNRKKTDSFPLSSDNPANKDARQVITKQQRTQAQMQDKILGTTQPPED